MEAGGRRYGRREHARALVGNALTTPLNVGLAVAVVAAGVIAGAPLWLTLVLAVIVYVAAALRTLFDEDVADRVLERETGAGDAGPPRGDVDLDSLAPEIRADVDAVRDREARIRRAIDSADLPYDDEVGAEVDSFVKEAERSARSAQLLYEGLADMPVAEVERKLAAAERDPAQGELAEALREQLEVARRIEAQLARYHAEMERLCVELDTVRAHLLSTSVTTDSVNQRRLASQVRGLREEMSAVAAGVEQAYDEAPI
jgi:hypothetical protein